jgi:hypothetical protein
VTRACEAITAVEAAHTVAMLATGTSTREAAETQGSANLRIKDAEDQAALAEREALERVS